MSMIKPLRCLGAFVVYAACVSGLAGCGGSTSSTTSSSPTVSPAASCSPGASECATATPSAQSSESPSASPSPANLAALLPEKLGDFSRVDDPQTDADGVTSAQYRATFDKVEVSLNATVDSSSRYGVHAQSDVDGVYKQLFSSLEGKDWKLATNVYCANDLSGTKFAADCVAINTEHLMMVSGGAVVGESDGAQIKQFAIDLWTSILNHS